MGLFDGAPNAPGRIGASADIAAATGWPVLLVARCFGAGADGGGDLCAASRPMIARVQVAGVVLNKVGSERHRRLASEAIEAIGVPVLGALPRDAGRALPERHLGLVQAGETAGAGRNTRRPRRRWKRMSILTRYAPARAARNWRREQRPLAGLTPPGQRIAVARDDAFSFFYPHLALSWREAGAELSFSRRSPTRRRRPIATCAGCPAAIPNCTPAASRRGAGFLDGLRRFAESRPVHGECGGYMMLGRALTDADGQVHAMAGLLRSGDELFAAQTASRLPRRRALRTDHCLGPAGTRLRGHEFHYATMLREEGACFAMVRDAYDETKLACGLRAGGVSGSFFHVIA